MALGLTFIVGSCLLLGILLSLISKNKQNISKFAIGLAFSIMLGMVAFDLIPEMFEHLEKEYVIYRTIRMIICIIIGIGILKLIDKAVPHHHEHNHDEDEHHLFHIGVVTSIAVILHNVIEGIAIFSITLNDIKTGLLLCLGVALHNIPLGIGIGSAMRIKKGEKTKKITLIILLTFSTTFGALFLSLSNFEINDLVQGSLISITLGMIVYIIIFEVLKELWENRNNKYALIGAALGIIIVIISILI